MLIVKKFGGTSVGDTCKIKRIAKLIAKEKDEHNSIVAIVSAMGKTTDGLVALAAEVSTNPSPREMDVLLSTGERITMSLLSIALHEEGVDSVSLTGSQCEIITSTSHTNARIVEIRASRIKEAIAEGRVVIVAGFQGVSTDREITTLGRGGSDTTAVAVACALGANRCQIYTDVEGVFTSDPRYVKNAKKIDSISYPQMMAMAYSGSGIMHTRALEIAANYDLEIEIKSTFTNQNGTLIKKEDKSVENKSVTAISDKSNLLFCKFSADLKQTVSLFKDFEKSGIEIFEYELLGEKLSLVFEKGFLEAIVEILKKEGLRKPRLKNVKSISLIGHSISHNLTFVSEVLEAIVDHKVISVNRGDKDITLILNEDEDPQKLIGEFHKRFIED